MDRDFERVDIEMELLFDKEIHESSTGGGKEVWTI